MVEEVEEAGKRIEGEVEEGVIGVALEDLETGSRMVEAEGEEEEKTGLETGMGDQAGEMRDLLREMRENLEIVEGMTGARKREKRSERREGERGRAGGGRRPCLLTCKLHSLPIRRRRRGEKQISSRSLKELRRVERSKTEDCRSRMKSPLDSRRIFRQSLLLASRCRRIQMELNSRRRL